MNESEGKVTYVFSIVLGPTVFTALLNVNYLAACIFKHMILLVRYSKTEIQFMEVH